MFWDCQSVREAVRQMMQMGMKLCYSLFDGWTYSNGSGMYSASKFAVRSLTEGLTGITCRWQYTFANFTWFVETEFAEVYRSKSIAKGNIVAIKY